MITWKRKSEKGYEVSTKGDKTYSALVARMPDGRTIEEWYQCDIKGYEPGGRSWRLGKGKPPLLPYEPEALYNAYLTLWRVWAVNHIPDMNMLLIKAQQNGNVLTDIFATSDINQARALAQILNEWVI